MIDINRDINSLSNFKRNTPGFLRQWKETRHPVVLTINGKAELVVQDTASYQRLIELAGRAEEMDITRQSVAEMKAGKGHAERGAVRGDKPGATSTRPGHPAAG